MSQYKFWNCSLWISNMQLCLKLIPEYIIYKWISSQYTYYFLTPFNKSPTFWSTMKIIMSTSGMVLHLVILPVNLYVPNDSLYWSNHVQNLLKGIKNMWTLMLCVPLCMILGVDGDTMHQCKTWIYRVFLLSSHGGAMQLTASARISCDSCSAPVSNKRNTVHYIQHDRAAAGFVSLRHSAINDLI